MSIEALNMELDDIVTKSDGEIKESYIKDSTDYNVTVLGGYRRVSKERLLLIGIFIIVLIILCLIIALLIGQIKSNSDSIDKNSPCTSLACLEASVEILNSVDDTVDPCTDFKQFACGKWESNIILPPGSSKFSVFEQISDDLLKVQKNLIDTLDPAKSSIAEQKMIKLYKSCLDTSTINSRGTQPFLDYIERYFSRYGGWQILKRYEDKFNLNNWSFVTICEQTKTPLLIVQFHVQDDFKDNRTAQLYLSPGKALIDKNLLERENRTEIINNFKRYFEAALKFFNVTIPSQTFLDDILELDIKLSKIHPDTAEARKLDESYHPKNIEQLNSDLCPIFNWTNIFQSRHLMGNKKNPMKIIVTSPAHLKKACDIIREYMTLDKREILHNYLMIVLLDSSIDFLSDDIQRIKYEINKYIYGVVGNRPRWQNCIINAHSLMPDVIGKLFINNRFKKKTKPQVTDMINRLKHQFRENLKKNRWMDDKTRANAIRKIDSVSPYIGYTNDILDSKRIEMFYDNVSINETMFFENVLNLHEKRQIEEFKKNGFPKKKTSMRPLDVNAFYDPARNEILFPAGILQPPFFDPGVPRSLKYAGIGTAISHELTHGFDNTGSKFGPYGSIHNWWTNQTRKIYNEKANCMIKQYSNYKIFNNNINGNLTLGENIADNGGARLAFQVFKNLQKVYGKEKPLPGVKYSHEQMFFITYARLWCSVETKASTQMNVKKDPHSPNKYRIIGVVSNMEEFSQAFQCAKGSPMNPLKKCQVW